MNDKLVTVIIAVYNGQNYIRELLDSILKQTYKPLEILITDDNSNDNSWNIIKKCKMQNRNRKNINIKIFRHKRNIGLPRNIASMRDKVTGEYIFLADQDDIWNERKIERQVEYLENNKDCFLCLCDRKIVDENGKVAMKSESYYRKYSWSKLRFGQVILRPSVYASNCMAFRNRHLDILLDIPRGITEHDTFIAVMSSKMGTVDFIHESLLSYRNHTNNLSGGYGFEYAANFMQAMKCANRQVMNTRRLERIDGKLLAECLKKYYYEELNDYPNFWRGRKKEIYIIHMVRYLKSTYETGRVGLWKK